MTNPRAIFNDELPWYLKCAGTKAELAAMDEAEEWEGKAHVVINGHCYGIHGCKFTLTGNLKPMEFDD